MKGCKKCGNRWSTISDGQGKVYCRKEPPYHFGCGKQYRLKRSGGSRRRAKEG
jgi:hypothetical protein